MLSLLPRRTTSYTREEVLSTRSRCIELDVTALAAPGSRPGLDPSSRCCTMSYSRWRRRLEATAAAYGRPRTVAWGPNPGCSPLRYAFGATPYMAGSFANGTTSFRRLRSSELCDTAPPSVPSLHMLRMTLSSASLWCLKSRRRALASISSAALKWPKPPGIGCCQGERGSCPCH